VGGAPHHHHADAGALRLVDGQRHALVRGHVAEPAVGVDERGDRGLADHPDVGPHVELGGELLLVDRQHREPVGIDAPQVGLGQDVGRGVRVLVALAPGTQDVVTLPAHPLGGDVQHGSSSIGLVGGRRWIPPYRLGYQPSA
jgi:hypothetical protein